MLEALALSSTTEKKEQDAGVAKTQHISVEERLLLDLCLLTCMQKTLGSFLTPDNTSPLRSDIWRTALRVQQGNLYAPYIHLESGRDRNVRCKDMIREFLLREDWGFCPTHWS